MRIVTRLLVFALAFGVAVPAFAQESPTPAKEETAEEAPAAEAPAAPESEKEAAAPAEHSFCAKALVPLADGYKKAYEELEKWIAEIDSKTSAAADKVAKIQQQIQENETAITKAKLEGDDAKGKELTKANKQLWSDLEVAKKSQAASCGDVCKQATQRVKQIDGEIESKLDQCKAQLK